MQPQEAGEGSGSAAIETVYAIKCRRGWPATGVITEARTSIHPGAIAAPGLHGFGEVIAHVARDAVALQTNRAGVAKLVKRFQEGQHIERATAQRLDVVRPAGFVVELVGATD